MIEKLAEMGVVQRFASQSGPYVHEVRLDGGLVCSCPGWRKYSKCWHMAFVVKYNVGANWRVGTFLKCLPTALDWHMMGEETSKREWLEENIAVARAEDLLAAGRDAGDLLDPQNGASPNGWTAGWGPPRLLPQRRQPPEGRASALI